MSLEMCNRRCGRGGVQSETFQPLPRIQRWDSSKVEAIYCCTRSPLMVPSNSNDSMVLWFELLGLQCCQVSLQLLSNPAYWWEAPWLHAGMSNAPLMRDLQPQSLRSEHLEKQSSKDTRAAHSYNHILLIWRQVCLGKELFLGLGGEFRCKSDKMHMNVYLYKWHRQK